MTERIYSKIEGLLKLAGDPNASEHERQLAQERAESIMAKHRIDMAMLSFGDATQGREIIVHEVSRRRGEYAGWMNSMLVMVYEHCGCKVESGWEVMTAVGYEDDLLYADMLWAIIELEFVSRMMPGWSSGRTFDENVYLLKESGKSWMDIVYAAPEEAGINRNSGARLRAAYARWAEHIGAEVKPQPRTPSLWREAFADGFRDRMSRRLIEMKAKANAENPVGKEGELALVKDSDRVNRFFWDMFPHRDPAAFRERMEKRNAEEKARRAAMSQKERDAEDAKREREYRRIVNRKPQYRAYDSRGADAGARAANSIDLSNSNKVGNNKRAIQ